MRFSDGDEEYPGQWWLWEQAFFRAINGKRGQRVLRDLEQALIDLPEKQLIQGHLSDGKGVCAVGAYVVHKAVAKGQNRDEVLAYLDSLVQPDYWDELDGWQAEEATIIEAQREGMQLTLACSIAALNDEYYSCTDEERYERVLAWIRARILPDAEKSLSSQALQRGEP